MSGLASINEIVEDIAVLKFQGSNNRHKAFDEATAMFALGPKRGLTPENGRPDLLLSEIVSWDNPLMIDKGPKRIFTFENIATCGGRFVMCTGSPKAKQLTDFVTKRLALSLELRARDLVVPERMQERKK